MTALLRTVELQAPVRRDGRELDIPTHALRQHRRPTELWLPAALGPVAARDFSSAGWLATQLSELLLQLLQLGRAH